MKSKSSCSPLSFTHRISWRYICSEIDTSIPSYTHLVIRCLPKITTMKKPRKYKTKELLTVESVFIVLLEIANIKSVRRCSALEEHDTLHFQNSAQPLPNTNPSIAAWINSTSFSGKKVEQQFGGKGETFSPSRISIEIHHSNFTKLHLGGFFDKLPFHCFIAFESTNCQTKIAHNEMK